MSRLFVAGARAAGCNSRAVPVFAVVTNASTDRSCSSRTSQSRLYICSEYSILHYFISVSDQFLRCDFVKSTKSDKFPARATAAITINFVQRCERLDKRIFRFVRVKIVGTVR